MVSAFNMHIGTLRHPTCCVIVLMVAPWRPMIAPTISLSTRMRRGKSVWRWEGEAAPGPPMWPPPMGPPPAAPLGLRRRSIRRSTRRMPPSRLMPLSRCAASRATSSDSYVTCTTCGREGCQAKLQHVFKKLHKCGKVPASNQPKYTNSSRYKTPIFERSML